MQKLIDYNKVEGIIKEIHQRHVAKFCEYEWSSDLTIDDVIVEAKTTKALELALKEIKATLPSNDDIVRVNCAIIALADHSVLKGTSEYDAHIKTVADYLGIPLPKEDSKDNAEGEE